MYGVWMSGKWRGRLRAALGTLGDAADRPRPFVEIEPRGDRTPTSRRRPALIAAASLVAISLVAWGVSAIRDDDRQLIVTSPEPSAETTSQVIPPTDPEPTSPPPILVPDTSLAPAPTVEVDGPWYAVDVPGVEAGQLTTMEGELLPGYSQTIWVSFNDSIREVLIMHRFDEPTDVTMLTGTEVHFRGPYGSLEVALISDPTDVPENDSVGDEARLSRDGDGRVFEFESYGMDSHGLEKNVLGERANGHRRRSARSAIFRRSTSTAPASSGRATAFGFALAGIPADRFDELVAALRPFEGTVPGVPGLIENYPAGWNQLPDSPLSPRTDSVVAWTGSEVIVAGGWEFLCPRTPTASCLISNSAMARRSTRLPASGARLLRLQSGLPAERRRWRVTTCSCSPTAWRGVSECC